MGRAVPGETSTIMKVFAVLLLAALAYAAPEAEPKPEADAAADAWYSYYGYGHPGYYGAYRGYYGLGGYGYRYWKRDAEEPKNPVAKREAKSDPEAEADPAVLYSSVYGHGLTYGAYGYPYA